MSVMNICDGGVTVSQPQRLMIARMELENFKSYAGAVEVGPLHKRFSSVVGPNGSGKSNVIDALLFVFGKRAKQLRLNKVSQLIHKSSKFPDLQYARVSVYFQLIYDDEDVVDDFEVVPGSEFVVTRYAYDDNTSKYLIDNKSSNFNAVGQLLKGYGIDLDNNRFLILQGEVEQIAMMKPKGATPNEDGLLEYLEDIIGSNRFAERIEEAGKLLDDMNEKRLEKVNKVKIAERERDNLLDAKEEAEAYMKNEREIRRAKNMLFQLKEKSAKDNIDTLEKRRTMDINNLESEQQKVSESNSILKEKENIYLQTKEEHDAITKEISDGEKEFKSLDQRDVKLQADLKYIKAQIKKIEVSTAKDAAREKDSSQDASNAQTQLDAALTSLKEVEAKKLEEEKCIEEIMEGLKEATIELRIELEEAQTSLTNAERGISSLQTEKDAINTSSELIKRRVKKADEALAKLLKKQQEVVEEAKSAEINVKDANGEMETLLRKIEELEASVETLTVSEVTLQSRLREAVSASEDGKASAANAAGKSNATYIAIMKAVKKGGELFGAGVKGRLGDLASVDPMYDAAISTACGSLDSIVVETTDGAQACIEFLRSKNAGRANFLPLDRMSQWATKMKSGEEFPAPRLFDIITPVENAYRPAFYHALRDTLVAESLESASEIAFDSNSPKWRVVTLSGELIDISGSMSGGGNVVKRGGMKLSSAGSTKSALAKSPEEVEVSPEDLKRLDANVSDIKAELIQCRHAKDEAEDAIKQHSKRLKTLEKDVQKMQHFLSKVGANNADISRRIEHLKGDVVMSEEETEEVHRLEAQMKGIDDEITRVSPNLVSHRQQVASLQRRILDVGGSKLARAQQRQDILSQQYEQLSSTVSTREVDVSIATKNVTKYAAARVKGEQDIESVSRKLESILKEQKEMEEEALSVIAKMEFAKERIAEKDVALEKFTNEYQEIKAAFSSMEKCILDFKVALEETEKLLQDEAAIARDWAQKLEQLRKDHMNEQHEFKHQVEETLSQANAAFATDEKGHVAASGESSMLNDTGLEIADAELEDDLKNNGLSMEVECLTLFNEDELVRFASNVESIVQDIEKLEQERDVLKATVNMGDLLKYLHKNAVYEKRARDLARITISRDALRNEFDDLRNQRLKEFTTGFDIISLKLKEMYRMITLGGDAELELVDSLDPFSEGIVFSVRPPKKSWKNISNLSGGEKTLSSLALVFALHHYKPTALYVMDEIDAALDFKNVSIVANYIKERTKNAQFVIISLRNNMFELADRLVGIYKTHDCTKSVTINPRQFDSATAGKLDEISRAKGKVALADATNTTV